MEPAPVISPTMERIIDAAQLLIQQNGYNGFSYEDLSRVVELKKPSIHHYFPKKENLGATVIERYTGLFLHSLETIGDDHASPTNRILAYVDLFVDTYGKTRLLCPCGMLGSESETLPDLVRAEVETFFNVNLSWLTQVVLDGKAAGEFSYHDKPETVALLLLAALEGAMVVGRGLRGRDTVSDVGRAAMQSLLTSRSL